jgi:hypothetical protein
MTSGGAGEYGEGVADGAEGDAEGSVEDGTGEGGDDVAVAVTSALEGAVTEARGDGPAAGREPVAGYDGAVAGTVTGCA